MAAAGQVISGGSVSRAGEISPAISRWFNLISRAGDLWWFNLESLHRCLRHRQICASYRRGLSCMSCFPARAEAS